jgi:hypothetical protein
VKVDQPLYEYGIDSILDLFFVQDKLKKKSGNIQEFSEAKP